MDDANLKFNDEFLVTQLRLCPPEELQRVLKYVIIRIYTEGALKNRPEFLNVCRNLWNDVEGRFRRV